MKKVIIAMIAIPVTIILIFVSYVCIWGGKPQIENFKEVSADYEIVAQLALDSYSKLKPYDSYPENECIIIDIYDGTLNCESLDLSLTEEAASAVLTAGERFGFLMVYEDAVFFCRDETNYY